jgi:hypothetical protein
LAKLNNLVDVAPCGDVLFLIEGAGQIQGILNQFREAPPKHISGKAVAIQDYQSGVKLTVAPRRNH